jgi:hypothetical protein
VVLNRLSAGLYPKPVDNEIETVSLSNPVGYRENSTILLNSTKTLGGELNLVLIFNRLPGSDTRP